ncbi:hypothetical protein [Polyangium jinanense]|uniref:Lipoprotein n=1 Tax=Polyangium jinanense TaxID=2829994 RepID=A0A9X4AT92_9BACT|nr:hypothetical protein [Polyangium jinanense]MDC3954077.1 hypothetical protein [Polyangium jinanense]MDC3981967.1 hypothetical protein [Polyangium jinanense]
MNGLRAFSLAFLLATSAVACSAPKPEPEIASSASQPGYAQDYPVVIQQIVKDFGRDDDDARTLTSGFSEYPKGLKAPDWSVVGDIHRTANDAGRSHAYVERNREVQGAAAFFVAEEDEIVKKVAGSATYVAKQKGCEVDLSGTVGKALTDSVGKQLEKRLRERNEAHAIIDRHRNELSKEDAATLEEQADQISRASYLVHIAMVEEKVRLRALIEEAEQVKKTLDDYIARERASQGKGKDVDQKASEARIARANESKAQIDGSLTQAREMEPKMEERVAAAQKRHADAMTALLADVDKRAKDAGQKK